MDDGFYDRVYDSPQLLAEHRRAQTHTGHRREALAKAAVDILPETPEAATVAFLGCGLGYYPRLVLPLIPWQRVLLIDKNQRALELCDVRADASESTHRMELDIVQESSAWRFDVCFCFFAVHLFRPLKDAARRIYASTVQRGLVVIVGLCSDDEVISPIGRFFGRQTPSRLVPKAAIREAFTDAGFDEVGSSALSFQDSIPVQVIPEAFSRGANSFLFSQKQSALDDFHRHLAATAINGDVVLKYRYSLLCFQRGRHD